MEQPVDKETNLKTDSSQKTSVVDRDTVLTWLKQDVCQLRKWATQPHTIKSSIRIYCLRSSIHGCSVILQALKDKEIEELAEDIEEIKKHVGMVT